MALTTNYENFDASDTVLRVNSPIIITMSESVDDTLRYITGYKLTLSVYNGNYATPINPKYHFITIPAKTMLAKYVNIDISPYLKSSLVNYDNCRFQFTLEVYYSIDGGATYTTEQFPPIASETTIDNLVIKNAYSFDKNAYNEQITTLDNLLNIIPTELPAGLEVKFEQGFGYPTLKTYDVVGGVETNETIYTALSTNLSTTALNVISLTMPDSGFIRIKNATNTIIKEITPSRDNGRETPIIIEYLNRDGLLSSLVMYGRKNEGINITRSYYKDMVQREFLNTNSYKAVNDKLHEVSGFNNYILNTGFVHEGIFEALKQMMLSPFIRMNVISDVSYTTISGACVISSYTELADKDKIYLKPTDAAIQKIRDKDNLINYTLNFTESNDIYFKAL